MDATSSSSPQWPKECLNLYSPVRVIGKGGFGNVYMAKKCNTNTSSNSRSRSGETSHVAIKVVGNDLYSQREVAILSELSQTPHPNIVTLIDDFKDDNDDGAGQHLVVMSLHRGPTLHYILDKGGSLGFKIAQSISKQLIDAIAYLHGHAIIHRDIHPANLIISGASLDDDLWWSDDYDSGGKLQAMVKKCHVTLIDFGFARALTPEDITESVSHSNSSTVLVKVKGETKRQCRGRSRTREEEMDSSRSRQKIRGLSALGTRNYAAPEILNGLRKAVDGINASLRRRELKGIVTRTSTSECIADYGMVADAFSVGTTIGHMITGIPPNVDEDEFLSSKNHPLKKIARKMKVHLSSDKKKGKRAKRYRLRSDLPLEINEVIQLLTHYDEMRRCTVRNARNLPWIMGGDAVDDKDENSFMNTGGPVMYLQCSDD